MSYEISYFRYMVIEKSVLWKLGQSSLKKDQANMSIGES